MKKYNSIPDTEDHIQEVRNHLSEFVSVIFSRWLDHDKSKLKSPEVEIFDEYTPKLRDCIYGSDEYKNFLKEMKVALDHHYSVNRHHPEYHENGIQDMNLADIVEMLCDWSSACKRHKTGNIFESIEINQKRFGYSDELKKILINTVPLIKTKQC